MEIKSPVQEQEPSSSLTPLMDVLFLLLIFFMLTTTFHKMESEVKIKSMEMPLAKNSTPLDEGEVLSVSVSAQGEYFIEEVRYPKDLLKEKIEKLMEGKKALLIAADKRTDFQEIVHIYDIIQVLGIQSFSHQVVHLP